MGVVVERMAGEEEPDGVVFALQPLRRQPRLHRRNGEGLARRRPAEQLVLSDGGGLVRALGGGEHHVDRRGGTGAVGLEPVEGAGRREALEHPLVEGARIDAVGEIGEIRERPLAPRRDDRLDRLPADPLQRRQRIEDGPALDLESRPRNG